MVSEHSYLGKKQSPAEAEMEISGVSAGEWQQATISIKANIARLLEMKRMMTMISVKIDFLAEAWNAAPLSQGSTSKLKFGHDEGRDEPGVLSSCQGEPERRPSPATPAATQPAPVRALPASPARSLASASAAYAAQRGKSVQNSSSCPAMPLRRLSNAELMTMRRIRDRKTTSAFRWLPATEFLSMREKQGAEDSKEETAHESGKEEEAAHRVEMSWALLHPTGPGPGLRRKSKTELGFTAQPPSQLVTAAQSTFQCAAQTLPVSPARIRPSQQTHAVDLRFLITP